MDIKNKSRLSPEVNFRIVEDTAFDFEVKPDLENLRAYTQTKLALAGQLRIIRDALQALGRENGERKIGELMVKLADALFDEELPIFSLPDYVTETIRTQIGCDVANIFPVETN